MQWENTCSAHAGQPPSKLRLPVCKYIHLGWGASYCAQQHNCLLDCQLACSDYRLRAAPAEAICLTSTAARVPVCLQVLEDLPVVAGGLLTASQADPQVRCLSLCGHPRRLSRHLCCLH